MKRKERVEITQELKQKFKELYKKGESTITIAKKLQVSDGSVRNYLIKFGIKLRNKKEAFKMAKEMGRAKFPIPKQHKIPESSKKLTKEKAYVLGVLCGDGYLNKSPKGCTISLNSIDEEFVQRFSKCLRKIYKITPKEHLVKLKNGWNNQHRSRLCSKKVIKDLERYHRNFRTFEWRIPKEILEEKQDIWIKFLQGFFDSEGYVSNKIKNKKIIGASASIKGLEEIKELLNNLDIKSSIYSNKKRKAKLIHIGDKKSMEMFNKKISFTIRRKKENLKRLIEDYKSCEEVHKKIISIYPTMVKLRNEGLSYSKIGDKLDIAQRTVWRHLNNK